MDAIIGAVDVGGNKIAVGLVTEKGELIDSVQWETDAELDAYAAIVPIADELKQLSRAHDVPLVGVGCAVTGPVDYHRGILGKNAFLPKWEGNVLLSTLIHQLCLPVFADNDAIASAMGEYTWGAGKGARSFIFICVSTGIGVSVIIDGRVYRGVDGAHPECGHHVIDINAKGPACFCGARGCWESLASGTAMERRWREAFPEEPLKAKEICNLAANGVAEAQTMVALEGRYLGVGIANLVTQFVPEVIALGGGVMGSYDMFLPYIEEQIAEQCRLVPQELVEIKPARFRDKAGLLGAAAVFPLYSYRLQGLNNTLDE